MATGKSGSHGIDPASPFPFLIQSKSGNVDWHVIQPHVDGVSHLESAKKGTFRGEFRALGFYSKHHMGVFTHQDSHTHLHFLSGDKTTSGHVDALELRKGDLLMLPAN